MDTREKLKKIAEKTLDIIDHGRYTSMNGKEVDIEGDIRSSRLRIREFVGEEVIPKARPMFPKTEFDTFKGTTLEAAEMLASEDRVLALNFASGTRPGGGFQHGAMAQEESLVYSSALYECIFGSQMYKYNRASADPMYSHWTIYTPDVPVFRDENFMLLDEPYKCSFLTCAAVNARAVREKTPERAEEILGVMDRRIEKILSIAAHLHHRTLVLGAWGCGVFGNDPNEISMLFDMHLKGGFKGSFKKVVFAIPDDENAVPFRRRFENGPAWR